MYNQIDLIPAGTARRDAIRLTKKKAKSLPRVTAYATARYVPTHTHFHICTTLELVELRLLPVETVIHSYRGLDSSYRFPELMKFFNARRGSYHTNPRIIVDVIYTPYVYEPPSVQPSAQAGTHAHVHFQTASSHHQSRTGDLLGVPELAPGGSRTEAQGQFGAEPPAGTNDNSRKRSKFSETPTEAEIFIFEYGTVVIWGMTEAQEKRFLSSL